MGRFQGRPRRPGRGRGRGGRSHTRRSQAPSSRSTPTPRKKTLADHVYYIGSAKQASDYVTNTLFFTNYVKKAYEGGNDVAEALSKLQEFEFDKIKPVVQVTTNTDAAAKEWKIKYQAYNQRVNRCRTNKEQAYALLWDQCSSTMKSKILSRTDYEKDIENNLIGLMKAIKQHALSYESAQYRWRTITSVRASKANEIEMYFDQIRSQTRVFAKNRMIIDAMKAFVNIRQHDEETDVDYLKRFKVARDVFYSHVGKDFIFPAELEDDDDYIKLLKQDLSKASDDDKEKASQEMKKLKYKYQAQGQPCVKHIYSIRPPATCYRPPD